MINIVETGEYIEIIGPVPNGTRVFLFLLAFSPMLAPYELFYSTTWDTYWHSMAIL